MPAILVGRRRPREQRLQRRRRGRGGIDVAAHRRALLVAHQVDRHGTPASSGVDAGLSASRPASASARRLGRLRHARAGRLGRRGRVLRARGLLGVDAALVAGAAVAASLDPASSSSPQAASTPASASSSASAAMAPRSGEAGEPGSRVGAAVSEAGSAAPKIPDGYASECRPPASRPSAAGRRGARRRPLRRGQGGPIRSVLSTSSGSCSAAPATPPSRSRQRARERRVSRRRKKARARAAARARRHRHVERQAHRAVHDEAAGPDRGVLGLALADRAGRQLHDRRPPACSVPNSSAASARASGAIAMRAVPPSRSMMPCL